MKKILSNTVKVGSAVATVSAFMTIAVSNFAFAACNAATPAVGNPGDPGYVAAVPADVVDIVTGKPCSTTDLWTIISNGINFMLIAIGTLSIVMIIVGGIRYTASGGNEKSVTSAKNTILYAIIGLVVAGLAGAIVNFVLGPNGIIKL